MDGGRGGRSCRGRRRAELPPTDLAGRGLVAGVEAEVAHDVATGLGDVPGEALEEVLERERHRLGSPVAVIGVAEHDTVGVESEQTAVRDRPASQIAAEVAQHAVRMWVALLDPDVPRAPAEHPQQALDADARERRREPQGILGEHLAQRREHLAAEERPHDADREEESVAHRPPPLGRESAARHEAVYVGVKGQSAAPSVERCEDAGPRAEEAIVSEQCQEGISDASKEQRVHRAPIVVPERLELVGDGEDDVVVIARQNLRPPCLEPAIDADPCTLRARTMSARVVVDACLVALWAAPHMTPECRGPTLTDGTRRAMDVRRQATRACVTLEAALEDVLQRDHALHRAGPRGRARLRNPTRTGKAPRASAVCSTDWRSAAWPSASEPR